MLNMSHVAHPTILGRTLVLILLYEALHHTLLFSLYSGIVHLLTEFLSILSSHIHQQW